MQSKPSVINSQKVVIASFSIRFIFLQCRAVRIISMPALNSTCLANFRLPLFLAIIALTKTAIITRTLIFVVSFIITAFFIVPRRLVHALRFLVSIFLYSTILANIGAVWGEVSLLITPKTYNVWHKVTSLIGNWR